MINKAKLITINFYFSTQTINEKRKLYIWRRKRKRKKTTVIPYKLIKFLRKVFQKIRWLACLETGSFQRTSLSTISIQTFRKKPNLKNFSRKRDLFKLLQTQTTILFTARKEMTPTVCSLYLAISIKKSMLLSTDSKYIKSISETERG